jgi:predicted ATPase
VLAPRALLERLGRRLDVLTGGRRDAPERHRTLRATIAWSHELLSDTERRLFAELAVFHAGWSLEASEAVAGAELLDPLGALVDHALVIRDGERFAMLETVREYAAEQLSALSDADSVRRRHALWFAARAEAAEPQLEGPEQAIWFKRLDADQENLRAASTWAVAAGEPELALRIGGALRRYWLARVAAAEMGGVLRAAAADGTDAALRAKALNTAGVLAGATDDFEGARVCFEDALALARESGERRQMARALGNLGVIASFAKDFARARAHYGEAAEIWHELNDLSGQSTMLQNAAIVVHAMGELEEALSMFEESVELARAAGDRMHTAARTAALVRVLVFHRPEDQRIPALLREALELSTELGERLLAVECVELVAQFALTGGEAATSAKLIGAADAERARAGADRKPDEQPYFEESERELERALDHETYERHRASGQSMSLEEAVERALACTARVISLPMHAHALGRRRVDDDRSRAAPG